ncbi:protein arginine N-methyltransferase 5-like [Culicoides brevitarsis]|uniref:protein arginine N-methyltransferase 5-like n=1 Tax=Culicoides brevitarsis TaxID=469753 RepID=UPI00307BAF57
MLEPAIILYPTRVDSLQNAQSLLQNQLMSSIVYHIDILSDHKLVVKEMLLNNKQQTKVIFRLTDGNGLDSCHEGLRQKTEKKLLEEINFAKLISKNRITYLYKLSHGSGSFTNLSRILYAQSTQSLFLLETKLTDWHLWNQVRAQADYLPTLELALEFTTKIPTNEEISRWLGEPIHSLIIPIEMFSYNIEAEYQELSYEHLQLLNRFVKRGITTVMLKGNTNDPESLKDHYSSLLFYINESLYAKKNCLFFYEQLMIPLQPLYENLSNRTYETFERDPAKYAIYQKAIESALMDLIPESNIAVLMIVGAGRGPLVRACINAGARTKRKLKIFIVEKNPSAIITLNALKREIWSTSDITIFAEDMRVFNPPEKADIIVSELLGSFGCNELSPECLDGAQKHLKPSGISIPMSYTSYVNPIMSSRIYEKNLKLDRLYHPRDECREIQTDFECNYIVCPKNIFNIADPKPLFTFTHPNNDPVIDNTRYKTVQFNVGVDAVLHGFLGYFEASLYKEHMISILPATHTEGMISWHCYYFPITFPQQLKAGQTIEASFFRCVSKNQVWYEWCLTKPNVTHIHNAGGRSFPIFK